MSEFKGTEGKWYYDKVSTGIKSDKVHGLLASAWGVYNMDAVEVMAMGESWLAMRERTKNIRYQKEIEQKANALLISKAPEMLEMLEELLEELSFHGFNNSTSIYKAKKLIKEATTL